MEIQWAKTTWQKRLWRTTDDKNIFIINSGTQLSCTDFRITMVNMIKDINYNIKNFTKGLETIKEKPDAYLKLEAIITKIKITKDHITLLEWDFSPLFLLEFPK